jgi:hypothetical protein
MPQVTLCLDTVVETAVLEEAVRTLNFMMPRMAVRYVVDADAGAVRFVCESADTLTLCSAVQMLKTLLGHHGKVKQAG